MNASPCAIDLRASIEHERRRQCELNDHDCAAERRERYPYENETRHDPIVHGTATASARAILLIRKAIGLVVSMHRPVA